MGWIGRAGSNLSYSPAGRCSGRFGEVGFAGVSVGYSVVKVRLWLKVLAIEVRAAVLRLKIED